MYDDDQLPSTASAARADAPAGVRTTGQSELADGEAPVLPETPVTRLFQAAPAAPLPNAYQTGAPPVLQAPRQPGFAPLIFGVILPLLTFGVEVGTRISAQDLFDPMPTAWHHALVLSVPLLNFWVWHKLRTNMTLTPLPKSLWWMNGFVLGVALIYAVLYAPILPMALIAVIFFGLGLLPLTPLNSLLATVALTRRLRQQQQARVALYVAAGVPWRSLWAGGALALACVVLLALPTTLTRYQLHRATSTDAATSAQGIQWLRHYGREQDILRLTRGRAPNQMDFIGVALGTAFPITGEAARQIYYRVYGRTFERGQTVQQRALLDVHDGRGQIILPEDGTGELMVGAQTGLELSSSTLDGSLTNDAALAYLEWTFVVKNMQPWQMEGRTFLHLPPGGVVSRLTLWVNGEEREAAFAARGAVTAAYEAVVRQRRDPVLVTSAGTDRVQVRFFPVPPRGEMKFRLGITAPYSQLHNNEAWLRLPHISERNFAIASEFQHNVWLEARAPLTASIATLKPEQPRADLFAVRGTLAHRTLAAAAPSVRITRATAPNTVWTMAAIPAALPAKPSAPVSNTAAAAAVAPAAGATTQKIVKPPTASPSTTPVQLGESNQSSASNPTATLAPVLRDSVILQAAVDEPVTPPKSLVVLLDGSTGMQAHASEISQALRQLPAQLPVHVLIAGDEVTELPSAQTTQSGQAGTTASTTLERYARETGFAGGMDNVAALARAWDVASQTPDSAIVWIHSAQPLLLQPVDALLQRWQRRPGQVAIYEVQVGTGANVIAEALDRQNILQRIARLGTPGSDLARQFSEWNGTAKRVVWQRSQLAAGAPLPADSVKTDSKHLARLWAFDEVRRTIARTSPTVLSDLTALPTRQAIQLATTFQLVTPLTGAVVLETQEQYDRAGLSPVARQSVPTIPEPETWLLLFVSGALLLYLLAQQRRSVVRP